MAANLTEKHRPRTLAEVVGQGWVVDQLAAFAAEPVPTAFLFEGETGVGKTTAAYALAAELGVDVAQAEFGGLHEIASGDQTGETVKDALRCLHGRPFFGSGWKVLVVNEADRMSEGAAFAWLDGLENLPPRTVVVFTTNRGDKFPARFRDRCDRLAFASAAADLMADARALAAKVWERETGSAEGCPDVAAMGLVEGGAISFRRVVRALEPLLRARKAVAPPAPARGDEARWSDLARRYYRGEKLNAIAASEGMSPSKLIYQLGKRGVQFPKRAARATA